jgi:GT2 family glycosyltransferase
MRVRLSVVVPTLNRPDALPRCVEHLRGQTLDPAAFELIVVEDVKNEAPPEIGETPFAVRLLKGERPGASSARNVGWRAARAPVVLFLGDDILGEPGLLERHVQMHDTHPDNGIGVLGHVRWARELPRSAFMVWLDHGIQFDYGAIKGDEAGPGHFYTANVSLKTAALERVDGFDEITFPFTYEDIDLGVRLFETGFRLLYDRGARAEHRHEPRLEDWERRMGFVAESERAWLERHPESPPYFHDRFAEAISYGPRRGRLGVALLHRIPLRTPVLGQRVWENADVYFKQQLGRAFMNAWRPLD